jgi:hypothetical protein
MLSVTAGNNNRLSSLGFVYDAAGNMTNEPGKSYQYDAENRLLSVNSGSVGSYDYGPNGERVRKVAGGATTYYLLPRPERPGAHRARPQQRLDRRLCLSGEAKGEAKGDILLFGVRLLPLGENKPHGSMADAMSQSGRSTHETAFPRFDRFAASQLRARCAGRAHR